VTQVHAAAPVIDYCHELLLFTRRSERFLHGLSPRAGIGLLRAAKAWALLGGRAYVIPEDIQAVLPSVAVHRLVGGEGVGRLAQEEVAAFILAAVPVA
jgi:MoxR-like ATPase